MKPALFLALFSSLFLGNLAAQEGEIPLRSGPSANCPVVGWICPHAELDFCKVCEKVDANGTTWAKIEVKGQVQVRCGGSRNLGRLMNRAHEWQVLPCRNSVYLCQSCETPAIRLTPCAVVQKVSRGLPRQGCICVCLSGWVCDHSGGK